MLLPMASNDMYFEKFFPLDLLSFNLVKVLLLMIFLFCSDQEQLGVVSLCSMFHVGYII